ncbi:glycosyltransferase [Paragemmobacter straminiformis]|uniref:Glycosyltransferase sugar-binding region containing DXD motif-containing protein n=1 Tax=Paragemmobacter straminiformis TaxID=2045119 RepID=A0A842I774_9RHOB|nr:hypothetical protein [Gemmobacter straminiformis]
MKRIHFGEFLSQFMRRFRAKAEDPVSASPLVEIASALDKRDFATVEQRLLTLVPDGLTLTERRLVLTFWLRVWNTRFQGVTDRLDQAESWFRTLERAMASRDEVWPLYRAANAAEPVLGAADLANSMAMALWDHLPLVDFGLQYEAISRIFTSGDIGLLDAVFHHLMQSAQGFVPDFWQFQSLARRWSESGKDTVETRAEALLRDTGRSDLEQLFKVYIAILRQSDVEQAFASAHGLTDPVQRQRLASYLLGASQTRALIDHAVRLHDALADPAETDERQFMQARLAVSNEDWSRVLELTEGLLDHPEQRNAVVCLRAMALAQSGAHENAIAAIDHVRLGPQTLWFLRGRASLIGMTHRILQDGGTAVEKLPSPALHPSSGKPLAQSLWVGPRLRWIEQLSMKSYLLNGWRYKLFVYDTPEGVPEGVELCDAASILPRSTIFREGDGSGAHKGSLGAFSDLFRYALLSKLGGLWTDTDVVNLRAFDAAGQRIIGSEWTDAGLIGPNGAMMAAPANDPLQRTALRIAQELVDADAVHFARIGPELLAELIGQDGLQGYRILPPHFLNPVGWMETGRLLEPFERTRKLDVLKSAHNLHVYTETWRLIGLGLSEPPRQDGFLPELYKRVMNATGSSPYRVMELCQDGT